MADIKVTLILDDSSYVGKLTQAQASAQAFGANTTKEMASVNSAIQSVLDKLGTLEQGFAKLATSVSSAASSFDAIGSKAKENSDLANTSLASVATSLKGLTGAFSLAATVSFSESLLKTSNEIHNLGESLGIGTKSMLLFGSAGVDVGKSVEDVGKMMERMVAAADQAEDGNMKLRGAFNAVGISMQDLQTVSPDLLFAHIAAVLSSDFIPASEKARLSMELFGRGAMAFPWGEFNNAVNKNSENLQRNALAVDKAADDYRKLQSAINDFKMNFLSAFGPIISIFTEFIADIAKSQTAISALAILMAGAFAASVVKVTGLIAELVMSLRALAAIDLVIAGEAALVTVAILGIGYAVSKAFGLDPVKDFNEYLDKIIDKSKQVTEMSISDAEAKKLPTSLKSPVDPMAARVQELKNAFDIEQKSLQAAQQRLRLELSLVTASEEVRKAKLAQFDEDIKNAKQQEEIANRIKVLQIEDANNPNRIATHTQEIALLQQELGLLQTHEGVMYNITAQLTKAREAQEVVNLYKNQELEVTTKLKDIQEQIAALGGGKAGLGQPKGDAELNAAIKAMIELEEKQKNRKLTEQEINDITNNETYLYSDLINKTKELTQLQAIKGVNQVVDQQAIDLQKKLNDLWVAYDEMTMSTYEKQIAANQKVYDAQKAAIQKSMETNFGASWRDNTTAVDLYTASLAKAKDGMEALNAATQTNIDHSKEFMTGLTQSSNQFAANAGNNAALGSKLFTDFTDGTIKAIDSMVTHGKFSFKDLFTSLLLDIMNAQIKKAMASALSPLIGSMGGMFGGGGGGGSGSGLGYSIGGAAGSSVGMGSSLGSSMSAGSVNYGFSGMSSGGYGLSMPSFAEGGTIPTSQPVLVGENGPEIITNAAGKNVIPNAGGNAGGSSTVNHNYTINAVDSKSVAQLFYENRMTLYGTVQQAQKELPYKSSQPQY